MREKELKTIRSKRRAVRTRKKVALNKSRVRLSVHRTNRYIYAQIIDDVKGVTIVSAHEKELAESIAGMNKTQKAEALGVHIAKKALDKKVKEVTFDKGSYRYHGRVKMFADGARKGGLQF